MDLDKYFEEELEWRRKMYGDLVGEWDLRISAAAMSAARASGIYTDEQVAESRAEVERTQNKDKKTRGT